MSDNLPLKSYIPLEYIQDDLFNLSSFVDSLYDLLNDINPERGFVISLNGEWGAGKSTVINFLKEKCLKKGNDSDFVLIDFLPWNIIDKQTLLKSYFITLRNCIICEDNKTKIQKLLEKYYSAIIEGINLIPKINPFTNLINSFVTNIFNRNEKSIFELKNDIIDYLSSKYKGKKIVICIDDLDRLTDEEICIVLRLIKEIADFPKIIYLISMDKNHVVDAINNHYKYQDKLKGQIYLEKFIQLERNLPQINNIDLEKILRSEIQHIVGDDLFVNDKDYFDEIYNNCIKEKLDTPRKLILLINQYAITYKRNKKYVNFVDYLIILFYQLFYPDFYIFIKENKNILTCNYTNISDELKKSNLEFIDNLFKNISCGKRYAKNVLTHLFPQWKESCGVDKDFIYTPKNDFMRSLVRTKDWFDFYFGKIDSSEESIHEIQEIVISCNEEKIINYLNITNNQTERNYRQKIQYLFNCWDYLNNDKEQLEKIILGILKIFNNKNEYYWYNIIKQNIFDHFGKEFYETAIINIINMEEIADINNSFLFLIASGNNGLTKRCISDSTCIYSLQIYIEKLIEYNGKFSNYDSRLLVNLLLKHQLFVLLEKYFRKYKNHSVILVFLILQDETYRLQYFDEKLLNQQNLTSEIFWKSIGNGELSFMKNYDKEIISFIKNEKYKEFDDDSIFATTLDQVIKQYANLVHLKIIRRYKKVKKNP